MVYSLDFSADGTRIASGGDDGTVRLWTLDGKPAAEPFEGHKGGVYSVAFSPDGTRIASGGFDGTVRLWTLDGKPAAEPFTGHKGGVNTVAFSPDGTRIASGGDDGTVRLWTLDGNPAAEPFEGHEGKINNVAFLPEGRRIVSAGVDGTVRLWEIAARTQLVLNNCLADEVLVSVARKVFWISCRDRIAIQSSSAAYETRGEIFLSEKGLVAIIASEGVASADRMPDAIRAVAPGGQIRRAVPEISIARARQILFNDWSLRERIYESLRRAYETADGFYAALGWRKAAFWPALVWLIAILLAVNTWIFVPHKLAHWAMPRVGSATVPNWKWLAGVLTLFGYLGVTERPLRSWLRKNYDLLYERNFAGRRPVKEREKYCSLIYETEIAAFKSDLPTNAGARRWITGAGGSGKSALAYRMLRLATEPKTNAPMPILVDEDWKGTLLDYVAELLKVDDRVPTTKMVEILGARGHLLLLIDSLSERGMTDATEQIADVLRKGIFKSTIVTSRQPAPPGEVWETFKTVIAQPLTSEQVPVYVEIYAPPDRREQVLQQIDPLTCNKRTLSPLFLRFAIEQALVGEVTSRTTLDLVLQYVEALRFGKVDLNGDDMLRTASSAATEAIRESLVPREIEQGVLRGVLIKEADGMPFMNAKNDKPVEPAAIIEMLVTCGLLNRNRINRGLQFAYDPVAEQLAAWKMTQHPAEAITLKKRILSEPDSTIAHAIAEIEMAA
jgi:WD domain, G-beta repeat